MYLIFYSYYFSIHLDQQLPRKTLEPHNFLLKRERLIVFSTTKNQHFHTSLGDRSISTGQFHFLFIYILLSMYLFIHSFTFGNTRYIPCTEAKRSIWFLFCFCFSFLQKKMKMLQTLPTSPHWSIPTQCSI